MVQSGKRLQRAEEIFFELLTLPESRRKNEIPRLCGGDPALAAEVTSLLEHESRIGGFLEESALGSDFSLLPATARAPSLEEAGRDEMIGRTIGRYRIERRLASGGMGTVYLAARADDQFTQRVAVKIVKRGLDTEEILGRFRRERQTLAQLAHPNIARLFDGGATGDGQPYLVMEYVEGEPIDEYCDRRRLDVNGRLRLFLTVCDAVRHAHQHLVVHRDLKPDNILVTEDGAPKLLDFGISTVLESRSASRVTVSRDRRLTPEYASPEHIAGAPETTASDVYSLGAILYELLCGRLPHRFATRTPEEIQRVVAAGDPRLPSEACRRSEPPSDASEIARARRTIPELLARRLRGDLDTIVMAALRKDPARRYPSVEALALDLRRFLDRLPVSARRDTFAYRASRFVRRHAVGTSLASLSLILLVAGGAGFAWQARVAKKERDQALTARAQSDAITGFLTRMLEAADPARSGPGMTVHEVLDGAAGRVDGELGDQPLVQASLRGTIGKTYQALGLYSDAEKQLREAYRLHREHLGTNDADTAESLADLASVLYATNQLPEAASDLETAVSVFRIAGETRRLAAALSSLGAVRRAQGELDQAERSQREALDLRRKVSGEESLDVAESLNNLAGVLAARGRLDEARPLLEDALRIRSRGLGESHPLVAQSTDNLAVLLHRQGHVEEAEPLYRKALELETRVLGPEHPDVAVTQRNLALLLASKGSLADAEGLLESCLASRRKSLPAADVRIVTTAMDLAGVRLARGRGADADPVVEEALEVTRGLASDDPARVSALSRAADYFKKRGMPEREAELRAQIPRR